MSSPPMEGQVPIRDILNRRTDLATFIVHLCRDFQSSAGEHLKSIISGKQIRAVTGYGWAATVADDQEDDRKTTQRVACFTETPLEHIYSQVGPIKGRQVELQPYGLAFTKMQARRKGINPVWYVDMTPGRDWNLCHAIEQLLKSAKVTGFHDSPIASLTPFIEQMGTWPTKGSQKEFWWEREWRHVDTMDFLHSEVAFYLCPEAEIDDFKAFLAQQPAEFSRRLPPFIDPRWSLETAIAKLANLDINSATPFPPS